MKRIILILILMQAQPAFGQINGGFEVWDTTYAACYTTQLSDSFAVPDPYGGRVNHWGDFCCCISQTTDSYSGNYSLLLYNWYGYAHQWITYHDSISYKPQYLQGYFKYITGGINGLSQGDLYVTLTRFNGVFNDTIATGAYQFDSSVSFSPFQVTLNYISAWDPDSIDIYIINGDSTCRHDIICNLLYLDNLILTNTPLGIENLNSSDDLLTVYPNPFYNILNIQNNSGQLFHFSLYNSLGQKIIDKTGANKTRLIDLSEYPNGIYYYEVTSYDNKKTREKIIKQ